MHSLYSDNPIVTAAIAPRGWQKFPTRLATCVLMAVLGIGVAHADENAVIAHPGAATFVDQQGAGQFGNAAIEASLTIDQQHLTG